MQSEQRPCRICAGPARFFFKDARTFYRCENCRFVFTNETMDGNDQDKHFQAQATDDPAFWRRVAETYIQLAAPYIIPRNILDFGSGNGGLSNALTDMGYAVSSFEPRIHGEFREQKYADRFDMIVANQVIEHLFEPSAGMAAPTEYLADEGILFVTSSFTDSFIHSPDAVEQFRGWWFKDDRTHVSFYCYWTLQFICDRIGLEIIGFGPIAAIMKKRKPTDEIPAID